jgi:hypothetical protein
MVQSAFVRGAQDHAGSLAGLKRFLPTRSTPAPTVAGFQAAKAEFRHRCRRIVATRPLRSDEAPVLETHLVKGVRPKARNEAGQKQINSARERAAADRVETTTGTIGRRHRRSAGEHRSTGEHRSSRGGKHVG